MDDPTDGILGPVAVAELRAVQGLRRQLEEQLEALARKEAMIVALVAEGQGATARGPFDYELDVCPPTWRLVGGDPAADG